MFNKKEFPSMSAHSSGMRRAILSSKDVEVASSRVSVPLPCSKPSIFAPEDRGIPPAESASGSGTIPKVDYVEILDWQLSVGDRA